MCNQIFHTIEPILSLTFYPVIAYDAIIGMRNFVSFVKRLKSARSEFFSVRLWGAVIAFCTVAGCVYGPLSQPGTDINNPIVLGVGLMLYAFPLIDYLLKKNRSRWDNWLCLPLSIGVLLTVSYCVAAMLSGGGYRDCFY